MVFAKNGDIMPIQTLFLCQFRSEFLGVAKALAFKTAISSKPALYWNGSCRGLQFREKNFIAHSMGLKSLALNFIRLESSV